MNLRTFLSKLESEGKLERIKKHLPELYHPIEKIRKNPDDEKVLRTQFKKMPDISIDYGVMEKTASILMIQAEFTWDDVGTWAALDRIFLRDSQGNIIFGSPVVENVHSCIIDTKGVNTIISGVENLIIVSNGRDLLIVNKSSAQKVKDLLDKLKK